MNWYTSEVAVRHHITWSAARTSSPGLPPRVCLVPLEPGRIGVTERIHDLFRSELIDSNHMQRTRHAFWFSFLLQQLLLLRLRLRLRRRRLLLLHPRPRDGHLDCSVHLPCEKRHF
jgi:hypothetical protein